VDSLWVKYAAASNYHVVTTTSVVVDTVFFAVPLADSLAGEGSFTVTFRAIDAVAADTGWVRFRALNLTVDQTAPPSPTLDPFEGEWRSDVFRLTGDWTGNPEIIRIYRDGAVVDTFFTIDPRTGDDINRLVPLNRGRNAFTATAVDEAKNESPPSNVVEVVFDDAAGMYISAPFRPNDVIHLNLARMASEATLRIYDLAGDLVVILEIDESRTNYPFAWDGINGDGEEVKKGPLVAVAEIRYEDGDKEVKREIFLFDPVY
jgi:hypothetical protein